MQGRVTVLLASARLPFLLLTPVSVLLGVACAATLTHETDWLKPGVILLTAIAAHVSVNAFNEYADFRIGLDAVTDRTPFSGGSGALPANPMQARSVFLLGLGALALTILGGLYLVMVTGWELLLPGFTGAAIVAGYTPWMTRRPLLSLFMPGLAFGPIMVMGTAYVLTRQLTLTMVLASMVTFFLVNNLLLLNQYPDIEADRAHGRRNLPILFGTRISGIVYLAFKLCAAAMILAGILLGVMPYSSLFPLVILLLALPLALIAASGSRERRKLIPLMAINVAITLLVPVMLALSMMMQGHLEIMV